MYKHLLAAVDIVDEGHAALTAAMGLSNALGAKLSVVHVVTPYQYPSQWFGPALQLLPQFREQMASWMTNTETQVKELISSVAAAAGYTQPIDVEVRQGQAATTILEHAHKGNHDLIVVASHSRSRLGRALLGSVAGAIVAQADIPVLVVRSPS